MIGELALGNFDKTSSTIYFNTDYAGTGYGRVTPFSPHQAMVGLYMIGKEKYDTLKLYDKFLKQENLQHLEYIYRLVPPPFPTGRVKKFQVKNILLVGRSAGLTGRLLGVGGPEALMSGVYAARAIIQGKNYSKLVKPLKKHVENISSFRNSIDKFTNNDFDKLLSLLGTPGIKQTIYNSKINFVDAAGSILKMFK